MRTFLLAISALLMVSMFSQPASALLRCKLTIQSPGGTQTSTVSKSCSAITVTTTGTTTSCTIVARARGFTSTNRISQPCSLVTWKLTPV